MTVQKWRCTDAQNGDGQRIGPVGPVPRHGKCPVGSPLENQRFNAPDSPKLQDRELLTFERMERVDDFRRSRKRAAVRCSYR